MPHQQQKRNLNNLEPLIISINSLKNRTTTPAIASQEIQTPFEAIRQQTRRLGEIEVPFMPKESTIRYLPGKLAEETAKLIIPQSEIEAGIMAIPFGGAIKPLLKTSIGKYILSKAPKISKILAEEIISQAKLLKESGESVQSVVRWIDKKIANLTRPTASIKATPIAQEATKLGISAKKGIIPQVEVKPYKAEIKKSLKDYYAIWAEGPMKGRPIGTPMAKTPEEVLVEIQRLADNTGIKATINGKIIEPTQAVKGVGYAKTAVHITTPGAYKKIVKSGFADVRAGKGWSLGENDPIGYYFHPSETAFKNYAKYVAETPELLKRPQIKAKLNLQNPLKITSKRQWSKILTEALEDKKLSGLEKNKTITNYLKDKGYDGIIDKDGLMGILDEGQIIVFDKNQINILK